MIVLDTHAWVWWTASPGKLSKTARRVIEETPEELGICAISCREVAMLVARGRLELDREVAVWIRQALAVPRVALLPLTPEVAILAADPGIGLPGDPADRMIAATAVVKGSRLITKDKVLRACERIQTVW